MHEKWEQEIALLPRSRGLRSIVEPDPEEKDLDGLDVPDVEGLFPRLGLDDRE